MRAEERENLGCSASRKTTLILLSLARKMKLQPRKGVFFTEYVPPSLHCKAESWYVKLLFLYGIKSQHEAPVLEGNSDWDPQMKLMMLVSSAELQVHFREGFITFIYLVS